MTSPHIHIHPASRITAVRPALIWGARGHAKVLAEFLPQRGFRVAAVLDNDSSVASPIAGVDVLHGRAGLDEFLASCTSTDLAGFVAIGGQHGGVRSEIAGLFRSLGIDTPQITHPTAFVATDATIGEGTQILANASVCTEARIGDSCIINTGASVDHECIVGNGVHIAPGVTVAGCVEIRKRAFIGAGATILPRLTIGKDAVIGAGAVVTKDIPDGTVAWGNPARVMRSAA